MLLLHRIVQKFNPNHDSNGRFSSGGAGGAGVPSQTKEIADAKEDLINRASGARQLATRINRNTHPDKYDHALGVADGYESASGYIGMPDQMEGLKRHFGTPWEKSSPYQLGVATAVNSAFKDYGKLVRH